MLVGGLKAQVINGDMNHNDNLDVEETADYGDELLRGARLELQAHLTREVDGTNNRTAQNSAIKKSGQAYISDISVTAANRQNSTLTVQFQGTGALS